MWPSSYEVNSLLCILLLIRVGWIKMSSKRRKVDDEKCIFDSNWTKMYFFMEHNK